MTITQLEDALLVRRSFCHSVRAMASNAFGRFACNLRSREELSVLWNVEAAEVLKNVRHLADSNTGNAVVTSTEIDLSSNRSVCLVRRFRIITGVDRPQRNLARSRAESNSSGYLRITSSRIFFAAVPIES